ncbi:nuclear transport factor 2 family protein [Streptomyces sp. NPDC058295]|uniref:nuclear transport factor 2 family protein n=1 Tax=Streptomyces sp. NPDC058295 TaxID=3346431 RepID=UPI0036F184AF
MTSSTCEAETTVLRYLQALNDRDMDALLAMIAPDAVFTIPGDHPLAGAWKGITEIIEKFMIPMGGLFAPEAAYRVEVIETITQGDRVVVHCAARSTARSGEPYTIESSVHFTVQDGKISAMREFYDTQYFVRMLFPTA